MARQEWPIAFGPLLSPSVEILAEFQICSAAGRLRNLAPDSLAGIRPY